MSVRLTDPSHVALYDSVTGTAFGLVFESAEHAEDYLRWLNEVDARAIEGFGSGPWYARWRVERLDPETGLLREQAAA